MIRKSSRHSKIAGDFGETFVLYWLSKHGFECAQVDHTGIDLIARDPETDELMGISVKSRTRNRGKETAVLNFPNEHLTKVERACTAFGCRPWFAFVIDAAGVITMMLMPLARLAELCPPGKRVVSLKMRPKWVSQYLSDPEIRWVQLSAGGSAGWGSLSGPEEDE